MAKCGNEFLCSLDIDPDAIDQEYHDQQCRVDVTGACMCQNPDCKKIYDNFEKDWFSWEYCSPECMLKMDPNE